MNAGNLSSEAATQLLRLRSLRAHQAETVARDARSIYFSAQAVHDETALKLEQHRVAWRKAETLHQGRLIEAPIHSYDLREERARLDAMADRAYTLQKELEKSSTILNTARQTADAARTHAARLEQAREQAKKMSEQACETEETMRTAHDEDELDELIQMRSRRPAP